MNLKKVGAGIAAVLVSGLLIWLFVSFLLPNIPVVGENLTSTDFNAPAWVEAVSSFILGAESTNTLESFIVSLAVFLILLFAFADILKNFSSFEEHTAWFIAFGLTLIGSVTGVLGFMVRWFGITSAIGALGIGAIVLLSVVIAVIFNLFLGKALIKGMSSGDKIAVNEAVENFKVGMRTFKGVADETRKESKSGSSA